MRGPSASCEIVFVLHDAPLRVVDHDGDVLDLASALFSGPQTKLRLLDGADAARRSGELLAGDAYRLVAIPAVTLRDACIPLDALWDGGRGGARRASRGARTRSGRAPGPA